MSIVYESISINRRTNAFNALPTCPLTLSGTVMRPIPSVAAPPCFDTRLGQRGMQRHAGWLLRWCSGRVFTKICMPPRRCLTSWIRNHVLPRGYLLYLVGWPLSWGGDGAARSCRGLAYIPSKGLAGVL